VGKTNSLAPHHVNSDPISESVTLKDLYPSEAVSSMHTWDILSKPSDIATKATNNEGGSDWQ
jgi:hypothetical protein